MANFVYNNTKNVNRNYILFKHNCKYHPKVFFENKVNLYLRSSYFINKLAKKVRELIEICYQNLLYA